MYGVEALLPAEHAFQAARQGVLDGLLEFGQGGMFAAAQRTDGLHEFLGSVVPGGHVFPAGGRAEGVDAVREVGHHVLPALTFGGRNPGVLEAVGVDADDGQKLLEHFQTATGVVVARGVMAVARMAARHQNAVGPVDEGLEHEERIHAARAGNADDAKVGRLNGTGGTGRVGAAVRAPVTQKTYDTELLAG